VKEANGKRKLGRYKRKGEDRGRSNNKRVQKQGYLAIIPE
jgi:hypothetical protein